MQCFTSSWGTHDVLTQFANDGFSAILSKGGVAGDLTVTKERAAYPTYDKGFPWDREEVMPGEAA